MLTKLQERMCHGITKKGMISAGIRRRLEDKMMIKGIKNGFFKKKKKLVLWYSLLKVVGKVWKCVLKSLVSKLTPQSSEGCHIFVTFECSSV